MKKLIAYDLDGTLANTRDDIVLAVQYMLDRMQSPRLDGDEIISYVGSGLHELVKHSLRTEDSKKIEQGAKYYRAHYGEHMMEHTVLYPDTLAMLEYFGSRTQAVITNKPNPFTLRMLEALGVRPFFKYVIASNDGYPKKPDPTSFRDIMAKEGIAPQEALYVGDSTVDIATGRAAGVETVILTHGFNSLDQLQSAKPDHLASGFADILELARRHGW